MKTNLHPTWYPDAKVVCACGSAFTTGSILPEIRVEICSACHPFFTGAQKFVDTLGQVDRFIKKTESSKIKMAQRAKILETRKSKVAQKKQDRPSLKDLLMTVRKQASS